VSGNNFSRLFSLEMSPQMSWARALEVQRHRKSITVEAAKIYIHDLNILLVGVPFECQTQEIKCFLPFQSEWLRWAKRLAPLSPIPTLLTLMIKRKRKISLRCVFFYNLATDGYGKWNKHKNNETFSHFHVVTSSEQQWRVLFALGLKCHPRKYFTMTKDVFHSARFLHS
jgi:hypothetical protein